VQILVVLSTVIIINQAATFIYDNQNSFNKTYDANGNYSEITRPYYFNATDLIENFKNVNKTFLPFLKSHPSIIHGERL